MYRTPSHRPLVFLSLWALALAVLMAPGEAKAQAHETRVEPYVLRSSTVATRLINAEIARQHGIEPAENRAVLNVSLLQERGQALQNVPAAVSVKVSDLTGRRRNISMRPVTVNDMVSYMGAFDFLPQEVLRMEIEATPEGSSTTLKLSYDERMWGPR